MLAKVHSFVLRGIDALRCEVEVDLNAKAQSVTGEAIRPTIVGLADVAVREAMDRIKSALFNSGYSFPEGKVLVNLAPADLKKEGSALELPITLGIFLTSKVISGDKHKKFLVAGELGLDGRTRPIKGALSMAMLAAELGMEGVLVPPENAMEAAVVPGVQVISIGSVAELVGFLNGMLRIVPTRVEEAKVDLAKGEYDVDFADVRGQELAKRALMIAASGRHNLILLGPPGAGKTGDKASSTIQCGSLIFRPPPKTPRCFRSLLCAIAPQFDRLRLSRRSAA